MHSHDHRAPCHDGCTARILTWSTIATVLFVVVEVVAGLKAGSLALLSDAGHNVTDALALLFTWFAFYLQSKPANDVKTYGYHRMGVLAAFLNAIMMVVACLGLLVNGSIMWGLRIARKNDLNVRSAFVHMLGDALGSMAIVAG